MAWQFVSQGAAGTTETGAFDTLSDPATLVLGFVGDRNVDTPLDNSSNFFAEGKSFDSTVVSIMAAYAVMPNRSLTEKVNAGSGPFKPGTCGVAFKGTPGVLDQTNFNADNPVMTLDTRSITPSQDNCLIVAALATNGDFTAINVSAGFTLGNLIKPMTDINYSCVPAWKIQTVAAPVNCVFDWNTLCHCSAVIFSFTLGAGTGEIKTRNEMEVNPSPIVKARNGLSLTSILRINELKPGA